MKIFFYFFFIGLFFCGNLSAQVTVVNKKGTVISVDSSKWTLSGTNIYNKNSGNVGIGNPSPLYKLDVTGKVKISDSLVIGTARVNTLNAGTINDSVVMADPSTGILKKVSASRILSSLDTVYLDRNQSKIYGLTGGVANTYTLTLSPAITNYVVGQVFRVRFHAANTGASTININGLGAKSLVKFSGISPTNALVSGDISVGTPGMIYEIMYDGTNFRIMDIGLKGSNTSSGIATAVSDETGSGALVFGTAPTFTNSILGSSVLTLFGSSSNLQYGSVATTMSFGGGVNSAVTHVYSGNGTASGVTKTINFGTGGLSGSTTVLNFGSSNTGAINQINIGKLISGDLNDSILVSNPSTGLLKRIAASRIASSIDTATMLLPYLRKVDTTSMLSKYLRKVDTTSMLSPYLRSNLGVKYTDTASMLSPYLREVDTTAMLAPYLKTAITSLQGLTSPTQAFAVSTSGTDFSILSSGSTHTFNMPSASSTNRGVLTSSDWGNFNQKVTSVTATTTAAVTTIITPAVGVLPLTKVSTVNNTGAYWNANQLQGVSIATTAPSNSQVLAYNSTSNRWEPSNASADSTTASNGLTLSAKDVKLGGPLTAATSITTTSTNTLALIGLSNSTSNDSIVVANPTTGVLGRISSSRLNRADSTTASNGLTLTGKDIKLGGALTAATTITNSSFPLTIATGGTAFNITGLTSGTANDSVMMVTTSGQTKRVSPSTIVREPWNIIGGTNPATSNSDNVYMTGNVSIGKSTNTAQLDVKGRINADSTIAAPNYTSTIQSTATGSAYTWNLNSGANTVWNLSSGVNTLTITNAKAGMYGLIRLVNSGTSTLTFASGASANKVINGGGGTVLLTQTSSAVDILTFFYDGSVFWWTVGNNYN